jgi:cation:H+ antiporter
MATVTLPGTETLLLLAGGAVALAVLVRAAGAAVDRALALAGHYGVSEVLVGVFVLSVGTSLPELATHVTASVGILSGTLDYTVASNTVFGSNMGSSTVQQFLLPGLLFVGFGRYVVDERLLRWSYLPMLATFALLFAVGVDGTISRLDGLALLAAFGGYTAYSVRREQRRPLPTSDVAETTSVARDLLVVAGSVLVVLASAYVILAVVETTVDRLRLGGSMIGVVTIGVASSLPEFSTVLESLRRRTPTLALGTLLGSNVVNGLVGVGLGGALSTYAVSPSVLLWDLPVKFGVGVAGLTYLLTAGEGQVGRREGLALVLLYVGYIAGRLLLFSG